MMRAATSLQHLPEPVSRLLPVWAKPIDRRKGRKLNISELVAHFGLETVGPVDPDFKIRGVRTLADAGEGDLSFLSNPKYLGQTHTTAASAVLLASAVEACPALQIICPNPYVTLARTLQLLYPEPSPSAEIHASAHVHKDARIGEGSSIGPGCVIEAGASIGARCHLVANVFVGPNVTLGADCKLFPAVVIYAGCSLGDRIRIHANSTIGSDGFGYAQDGGEHVKVPQIGSLVIEDDVEIGANSSIDRGSLGDTRIGKGTKIDNQVQVAHNVTVGEGSLLVAFTGLAGSSSLGKGVVVAGKGGTIGHVHVGDGILIMGDSVVTKNLDKPGRYAGNPAIPHIQYQRQMANLRGLSKLKDRVKTLEKRMEKANEHD